MDELYHQSREIFKAVKEDNIKKFDTYMEMGVNRTLRYGKFPLLSVCYLFKANKIIKKYEKMLLNNKSYNKVAEESEIYDKFRSYSKRCFRIYLGADSIISPLEMLYIMGEKQQFEYAYPIAYRNDAVNKNLKKLHKIQTDEELKYKGQVPIIPKKPMTSAVKLLIVISLIISFCGIVCSVGIGVNNYLLVIGTEDNPYLISSAKQFAQAMDKGDKFFRLTKDIELSTNEPYEEFLGNLDGGGHTVTLVGGNYLFRDMKGKISNLKVNVGEITQEIIRDKSFFVLVNSGEMSNIEFSGTFDLSVSQSASTNLYIGGAIGENSGTIDNFAGNFTVNIQGRTTSNTYLGGLVAINTGTINNIKSTSQSSIVSNTVDIAGLVAINNSGRKILNAVNNAKLIQTTAENQWSPNVGGIVSLNNGFIENSHNSGEISGISTAEAGEGEGLSQVLVGGIVTVNNGSITDSFNEGKIEGISKSSYVQIGGITAQSSVVAIISKCYSKGEILGKSERENSYVFLGGIVGNNNGQITKCYNIASLQISGVGEKDCYIGGIMGMCNTTAISNGLIANNYYLSAKNVPFGSGGFGVYVMGVYNISLAETEAGGCTRAEDMQGIINSGVYFE